MPRPPSSDDNTVAITTVEGKAEDDDVTTNTQEAIQEIKSNSPHTNTRRNKVATREIVAVGVGSE